MDTPGGYSRGRLGTAAALLAAAVLFRVFDWAPLLGAAGGMLLLALPPRRPFSLLLGAGVLAAVAATASDFLGLVTLAWSLVLGGALAITVLRRPEWPFLTRGLAALAVGITAVGLWLGVSGGWAGLDATMRTATHSAIEGAFAQFAAQVPEFPWPGEVAQVARVAAEMHWTLFPAMAALQALALLALAWWAFVRVAPHEHGWRQLRPLREFRFNDHMVWAVIAGLSLLLLPLGEAAERVGANVLFFMGGLYTLRGLAVMLFMAGTPSLFSATLGVFAVILLSRYVLPLALLVGIGDTWLDVRKRVALAPRV